MMKKNILYLVVITLLFVACNHNNLNENKACVNISFNSENRMVYPSEVRLDEMDLIEFYLDSELVDSWNSDENNTAYYNFWTHKTFFINPGIHSFEFKLYDDQNNYFYGGKEENKEIIFGDNYIHIQLERKLPAGNLEINYEWEKKRNIFYARAGIFLLDDYISPLKDCDFESLEITYGEEFDSISYSKNDIPTGDYFVKVELFNEANLTNPAFCEYDIYRIEGGSTTKGKRRKLTDTIFNEYYKLNYVLGEGAEWVGEEPKPYYIYDRKMALPTDSDVQKEGYTLLGWYGNLDNYNSKISEFSGMYRSEVTLYARWKKGVKKNISEFGTYMDELEDGTTTDDIVLIDKTYNTSKDFKTALVAVLSKADEKNIKVKLDLSQIGSILYYKNIEDCKSLVKVTLPEMSEMKFHDCINLKELVIPKFINGNISQIISGNTNIEKVIFEGDFKKFITLEFNSYALFENTNEITHCLYVKSTELISGEVQIPEGVGSVYNGMNGYNNITKLIFPSTVEYIDKSAFNGCSNLSSVSFGENLRSIDDHAFRNCKKFESVTIPNSVYKIGGTCFSSGTVNFEETQNWYYLDFNDYKNWNVKEGGTRIENMNDFYNEFVINEGYINRKYKFYRLD